MLVKIIVGACNKTWMDVITKINSSKGQRDILILRCRYDLVLRYMLIWNWNLYHKGWQLNQSGERGKG